MKKEKLKIIYQDKNLLVVDKPSNIIVFSEKSITKKTACGERSRTMIDLLLEQFPHLENAGKPLRYGIVHRLDKDTSGVLLVAKNNKTLFYLQKQFKEREVSKRYIALVTGRLREKEGEIKTLIGRSPKDRIKQKVYFPFEPSSKNKREAVTNYRVLSVLCSCAKEKKENYYTLVEVITKTGRKHQIRTHFNYLGHPVAGDKLYGFKNQISPAGLKRHFLHASFLEIKFLNGKKREFKSELPEDLTRVLENLNS